MTVMQININDNDITQQENAKEEAKPKEEPKKPNTTSAQPTTTTTTTQPSGNVKTFGNLFGTGAGAGVKK